jgi:hypothetical protein
VDRDSYGGVEIVATVCGLGETALCALIIVGGVVRAAINAQYRDFALAHIRQHVDEGFGDVQVCSLSCPD